MSQAFRIFVLALFVHAADQAKKKDTQLGIPKDEWKQLSAHNAVVTLRSVSLSLPGLQTRAVLMCSWGAEMKCLFLPSFQKRLGLGLVQLWLSRYFKIFINSFIALFLLPVLNNRGQEHQVCLYLY